MFCRDPVAEIVIYLLNMFQGYSYGLGSAS